MSKLYVQSNTLYLAGSGVIIGATSIVLSSLTDIYGDVLTMANFGDKGYGTLEPDTTNEESFIFTGIVANANGTYTLTGVSTTLAISPYTETSGLVRAHSGGTKMVITDNVAFWATFANKNNAETILNKWTFPLANRPTMDSDADSATATDLVTVGQLSRQAISGAANAATGVKGIVQLPTQAQVDARTTTGSTGALLVVTPDKQRSTLLSDYVVDTGSANAYVITPSPAITAYVIGQIFSFKAVNPNTTISTLVVNGLSAITIKNSKAGNLVANDILAGQIVVVEYDGTNFQMLSNSGNLQAKTLQSATTIIDVSAATAPTNGQVLTATGGSAATWQTPTASPVSGLFGSGATTKNIADASTTQNIAHGLGIAPKAYRLFATTAGGFAIAVLGATITNGNTTETSNVASFILASSTGNFQTGVITTTTSNISIAWTKNGSPTGTMNIIWEAWA